MLDFIADRADVIIAVMQAVLTAGMLPVVWHQFRAKASTVPLTTSVLTAAGLATLGVVFLSTGMFLATGTLAVGTVVWSTVAVQRVLYNRGNDTETRDPDTHVRANPSWVFGIDPVFRGRGPHGRDCVHYARAGWCWHRDGSGRRGAGQEAGVGVEGAGGGAEAPEPCVPDYVHYTPPAAADVDGDSAELEGESR